MQIANAVTGPLDWLAVNWPSIAFATLPLVIGGSVAGLASRLIGRSLPRRYGVSQNFAPLLAQAARYGIIIFAIATALSFLGVPSASLVAVLAAAGLAIA